MVYPKRIVFEDSKRTQEISLSNNGNDTARYVISVIQIRMKEDGNFETITSPDSTQLFADKNFRFFPRNVILGPKEAQTIKIQLIKTNELKTGEYRSHIYIRSEAEQKPLGSKDAIKKANTISVNLVPIFGISVPVIIKIGESTTKTTIAEPSFLMAKDDTPAIKFKVNRSGNMSTYGDITINYISSSGKTTQVAIVQGLAIYFPTSTRQFQILLDKTKGIKYNSGKLQLIYSKQRPASAKLAEAKISL